LHLADLIDRNAAFAPDKPGDSLSARR